MFSKFVIQQEAGQIMIHVKNNPQYYINARALTFSENDLGDPNRVAVSLVSGTVVMVHEKGTIDYASDGSYEKWTLRGYSTKLVKNDKYYIYARLSRADKTALIVFSANSYNLDGSITTVIGKDEEGNDITETTDPNENYFYVKIGELTETNGSSMRELTYDSGLLGTDKAKDESDGLSDMWELSKLSTPWLIRAKQWLADFTVKGFIKLVGGLKFSKGQEGDEKHITDIKRSVDSDNEFILDEDGTQIKNPNYVPISDEVIPSVKYLHSVTDERFLRKDKDDRSVGTISSDKGFEVGDYLPGELGIGGIFKIDENGDSYLEVDKALFRKIAYFIEIMIKKLSHVGGSIILSPASMKCSKVEEHGTYYRCYFENEKEGKTINQEFVVGDQARSQTFNIKEGLSQNVSNQYYWRLVVGVGKNYIDLSKADCDSGSGVPMVGDDIVLLGNRNNPERQNAIILSSYGEGTPSFRQYKKIHTYSMSDAELVTEFSPESNLITGKFISESGKNLEEEFFDAKVDWDKVLEQTDKEFSMWFFPYSPSADVVPEVDWVTPELKALHEEDLFYNTDDKSKDGGKAWRYTFKNGSYVWEIVTDAETIKALEKASNAQKTADEKIRNFITEDNVLPPPPYDKGDRWCNANFVEGNVIYAEDDDMVCITPKAKGEEPSINDWRHASAMNSDTRHAYDAKIKNLGDSIQLTVEKTDQLAGDVSILAEELDGVSEQIRIYASKLSFDSNGNVTNISTSGLVTTSNYVSIFSQYKSQTGAVVQSEISAFVTENDVGEMISNITITADNVDINNGVVSIDKTSATIGGFIINSDSIVSDSTYRMIINNNEKGSGSISWENGGDEYAKIGVFYNNGYYTGSLSVSNNSSGNTLIIPSMIQVSGSYSEVEIDTSYNGVMTFRRYVSGYQKSSNFGIDASGYIRIGGNWYDNSTSVNVGELWVDDDGYIKLRKS